MKLETIDDIEELIAADMETDSVEFKETTGQLERGMETLCAFLNRNGGTVLFGVTDRKRIIGQEVSDKTKREIAEAVGRIEPTVPVWIYYVPMPDTDRKVIAMHVEDVRLNRPYMYRSRPYMRIESVTCTMPQSTYNELLLLRDGGKYRWELFENRDLRMNDIDGNEVLKTVRLGIECGRLPEDTGNDLPMIMEKLGLIKYGVLNHAAAVLFASHEMPEYSQCLLRLARFKGTDKTVFIDSQRIQGNLFQLLNSAMAFVFKHLSLSGTTDTLEREEHLTVPYKAIREGILNSLCHRDYRVAGGSVGIAIYDDRVEIENPGAFPHDWDITKMKNEHCSEPQNPLIATILYKRKMLENWGRGISLMSEECKKAGLPEPEYRLGGGFVVLVFRYVASKSIVAPQLPHSCPIVTPQLKRILNAIGDKACSTKEIMEAVGLKDKRNILTVYIYPAIEHRLVERLYPDTPNHPQQRYRLTVQGRDLLE